MSLLLACTLAVTPASAHKLKISAFADGGRIEGSVHFAGGGKAAGTRITIKDAAGMNLARLTPAADGSFSYAAKAPVDHLIVADSGDGHRAEWRITAAELSVAFPRVRTGNAPETTGGSGAGGPSPEAMRPETVTAPAGHPPPVLDPALETAIESAVARQVRPLREMLTAAQDAYRLRDILGGIGYIVGLAGLALWWQSRRRGNSR